MSRVTQAPAAKNTALTSALKIQARIAELQAQLAALAAEVATPAPSAPRAKKIPRPVANKTPRTTTKVTLRVATRAPAEHPELDKNTRGTRAQACVRMPERKSLRVSAWYDLTDAGYDPTMLAELGDWDLFAQLDDVFGDVLSWAHATIALGTKDARYALGCTEARA